MGAIVAVDAGRPIKLLYIGTASQAQVDLFAPPPEASAPAPSAAEAALAAINPDALSPREALDVLYQLKKLGTAG